MAFVPIPRKQTWLTSLRASQVKKVQRRLNRFFRKHLEGYTPLRVDGKPGDLTRKHIKYAKWFLGYKGARTPKVNRALTMRLYAPNNVLISTKTRVQRGQDRRRAHNVAWRKHQEEAKRHPHVEFFDGKPVAAYFVPHLRWARAHGWHGSVVSGYRTPAYSESLCYHMCGRPSCPGTCAGRATNHAGLDPNKTPSGAIDVSDYINFGNIIARSPYSPHIHNALPRDRVHFSPRGN